MINQLPFIGWFLSFVANVSLAVPFWFFWTHWKLGSIYFYFVPPVYWHIPFWDCVGLFLLLGIFRGLIPTIVSVRQSNSNDRKKVKSNKASAEIEL